MLSCSQELPVCLLHCKKALYNHHISRRKYIFTCFSLFQIFSINYFCWADVWVLLLLRCWCLWAPTATHRVSLWVYPGVSLYPRGSTLYTVLYTERGAILNLVWVLYTLNCSSHLNTNTHKGLCCFNWFHYLFFAPKGLPSLPHKHTLIGNANAWKEFPHCPQTYAYTRSHTHKHIRHCDTPSYKHSMLL